LRGVRYPKNLVNSIAGHPHNPIVFVDNQRDLVALSTRDFQIDEKVLELFPAAQSDGPKTVSGPSISYGQTSTAEVAANPRQMTVTTAAHDCTLRDGVPANTERLS
jgi:hypothetical protein